MICPKCEGRTWVYNPKNKGSWDFEHLATIHCGKCKGTGYVIGSVADVLGYLKVFKENRSAVSDKDIQSCIDIIEKY